MGKKQRGRPKIADRERYENGRLKPVRPTKENNAIAPTLLHRICDDAKKRAADPLLGTALGRLRLQELVTSAEAAAGFKLAEVYGRYGFYHGRRRTAKSPAYESGFHAAAGGASCFGCDEDAEAELSATAAFRSLPIQHPGFSAARRAILERLCVENETVPSHCLPDIRVLLAFLAEHFGTVKAGKRTKTVAKTKARDNPQTSTRIISRERDSWIKVIAQLRPDLDEKESVRAFDIYKALAAREEFRDNKSKFRVQSGIPATNYYAA